jgi:hypothetical protein
MKRRRKFEGRRTVRRDGQFPLVTVVKCNQMKSLGLGVRDEVVKAQNGFGFERSDGRRLPLDAHSLGFKYTKISGFVTMESAERQWEYEGGFPPRIYARLCDALNLDNYHSGARATQFESFEERKKRMLGPVGS